MAEALNEFGGGAGQTPLSALGQGGGSSNKIAGIAGLVGSALGGLGSGAGSGGIPTPRDVGGNIDAGNKTFGTATSYGDQTFNTAKSYNDQAHQQLNKTLGIGNTSADALLKSANQNLDTYSSTFSPLQKQQADFASNYGSDKNVANLQGQAVSDVGQAVEAGRQNSARALASEGVDPASIHGGALDRQDAIKAAAAKAGAGTQSGIQTRMLGQQLVGQANQLGLQVGAQGQSAAAQGAGVANQTQDVNNTTNSSGITNLQGAKGYLDTAVGANKSAADIAHQDNQDQLASAQAKQAASGGGLGGALGAAAGFVASNPEVLAMMSEGGVVPQGIPTSYSHGGNVTTKGALPVSPIPGSTDTKPALLTPGEFVMPKDVVDFKGQDYFHRQIDSIRKQKNKRQAIPTNHAPHIQMVH